jgi:hypothetical protein
MGDADKFRWFVPSELGDESPDALLSGAIMRRIEIGLFLLVGLCALWNLLDVRTIRTGGPDLPTLAEVQGFFLRPSTVALWALVAITVIWLIARYLLTREPRFALAYEALILIVAAVTPLLSMEIAEVGLKQDKELRLSAYDCPGPAPEISESLTLADCSGYPVELGTFGLAGTDVARADDTQTREPTEIAGNTAMWNSLPSGRYVIHLLASIPGHDCSAHQQSIFALDTDLEISCLSSGDTSSAVIRLIYPDDAQNLRLAVYQEELE